MGVVIENPLRLVGKGFLVGVVGVYGFGTMSGVG
jgi:hypothetical protein